MRLAILAAAGAAALGVATNAFAEPKLERVRGTVEAVTDTSLTVKTAEGSKEIVRTPDTKFAWVVASSLDEVKDGKFIGTATKGEDPPVALEVVVFPASMNGTAEGHYAWDSIQDTTAGGKMTRSKMTNGTVKSSAMAMTKSKMTNGTIKQGTMAGKDKMITVTYDKGEMIKIKVPPTAPVVALDPADKAIVTKGSTLFLVAAEDGGKWDGKLVLVGKGDVKPPM